MIKTSSRIPIIAWPVIATIVIYFLAFVDISGGAYFHLVRKICDGGHLPAFAVLYLVIYYVLSGSSNFSTSVKSASFVALIAASVEIVQPYFNRSCSVDDLARSLLGMFFAAVGVQLWNERATLTSPKLMAGGFTFLFSFALVWAFAPAMMEVYTLNYRSKSFPVLGEFDNRTEFRLWTPNNSRLSRAFISMGQGLQPVLKVETTAGVFSGVEYRAGHFDWSKFRALRFTIVNTGQPLALHIRIDDSKEWPDFSERFNSTVEIPPGSHEIVLPMSDIEKTSGGGKLNTAKIGRLMFFVAPTEKRREFYLDHVFLE